MCLCEDVEKDRIGKPGACGGIAKPKLGGDVENVQMRKWEMGNGKMCKCANGEMCLCGDAKKLDW